MKTIRKIMEGVAAACISVAMYYCFLSGAPARGTERTVYMILDGILCEMASQTEQRTGKYDKDFA